MGVDRRVGADRPVGDQQFYRTLTGGAVLRFAWTLMTAAFAYALWAVYALVAVLIVTSGERQRAVRPLALASLCLASAFTFAVVSWGRATPFGDFDKAYYHAGRVIFSEPARLYECAASNLCFVNIPIVAALFTPLATLPHEAAHIVFSVLGVMALAVAAWMLIDEVPLHGASRDAFIALLALNGPLFYSVRLGNLSHVLLPLVAFAFLALARQREYSGSVALALLTVLKPPLLLFAPYLALRGRWRALGSFGVTLASIVALSVLLFGWDLHAAWLRDLASPYSRLPVTAYNAQSVSSMVARFFHPYNLTGWEPVAIAPGVNFAGRVVVAGLAVMAAVVAFRSGPPKTELARWYELSAVLVLALLAAPVTWTHYYVFCLVPLAAFLANLPHQSTRVNLALGVAVVLVSAPVVLTVPTQPVLRGLYERLLVSHYVFGALTLFSVTMHERFRQREFSRVPSMAPAPAPEYSRNIASSNRR